MRRHISLEHKQVAIGLILEHGLSYQLVFQYTGISVRSLKRLVKTYTESGELVWTPVCPGRPRMLDALEANVCIHFLLLCNADLSIVSRGVYRTST